MSFHAQHLVPAAREQVWQWHTRFGAASRLTPPFLPMAPLSQASNLRNGTTVFGFPAGLRWIAEHDPAGYVEGSAFTDVCTQAPIRAFSHWRHEHKFQDSPLRDSQINRGQPTTLVTDNIDSRLPGSLIAPIIAYRQHQLRGDITALKKTAHSIDGYAIDPMAGFLNPTQPLNIALTGSRGAVGRNLSTLLSTAGHKVIQLVRSNPKPHQRLWNPHEPKLDMLEGIDVVIHLAGEPIFGRFNEAHKKEILNSRLEPTYKLAQVCAETESVQALISASAIGFYGHDRGDEILTEDSAPGSGFLADVTRQWESATSPMTAVGKRVVNIRTGVVMDGAHGLLPLLRVLFSTGLGGRFGDGDFWFSWIAMDDLCDIYLRAAVDPSMSGTYNATAPHPVLNRDFAAALGDKLNRPALLPIPALGPTLLFGKEGARELALANQRVHPSRITEAGFTFRYSEISAALAHELGTEQLV